MRAGRAGCMARAGQARMPNRPRHYSDGHERARQRRRAELLIWRVAAAPRIGSAAVDAGAGGAVAPVAVVRARAALR
ncbi:hypothetical protein GCM10017559_38240 [Streptosporangium longisporum]|uniref:Uncharacterized protein n=1 Tax=Streptosporangium longisporum TaxID=46187 RepID=A0ABN3Y0D3_9ACTN